MFILIFICMLEKTGYNPMSVLELKTSVHNLGQPKDVNDWINEHFYDIKAELTGIVSGLNNNAPFDKYGQEYTFFFSDETGIVLCRAREDYKNHKPNSLELMVSILRSSSDLKRNILIGGHPHKFISPNRSEEPRINSAEITFNVEYIILD